MNFSDEVGDNGASHSQPWTLRGLLAFCTLVWLEMNHLSKGGGLHPELVAKPYGLPSDELFTFMTAIVRDNAFDNTELFLLDKIIEASLFYHYPPPQNLVFQPMLMKSVRPSDTTLRVCPSSSRVFFCTYTSTHSSTYPSAE